MLQLLRRFLRWLLKVLGGEAEVAPSKESPAVSAPPSAPPILVTTPELGLASSERPRYQKSRSLFSPRELVFYRSLVEAVGSDYQIFAKVRMADFVFLANEPKDRKAHVNPILCKHVDFLLCARQELKPVLAIELDDSSHRTKYDTYESDEFKKRTLEAIGLPLLRIELQPKYSVQDVRERIGAAIRGRGADAGRPGARA